MDRKFGLNIFNKRKIRMYSAFDIAKYIINYCKEKGYSLSNLKLQKVLYFVQAQFLLSNDKPCFYEAIEAWDFGPVVPDIYHEYKIYGSSNITVTYPENSNKNIQSYDKELINEIIDQCAKVSASRLVEITHQQKPWINSYEKYFNNEITVDSIKNYFLEKVKN